MKMIILIFFEIDEDKSEAYFEIWDDGVYKVFAIKYTLNSDATVATLIGEETEVILQSEYKEIEKSKEDSIVEKGYCWYH